MRVIKEALHDFIDLVYPVVCITCQDSLKKHEGPICTHCRMELPKTDYHLRHDNEMAIKFYGKVPVQFALAYLLYVKQGKAQKLVHALKYKGQESLGHAIGLWYGHDLKAAGFGEPFDLITCVPLHASRFKMRGYNQAASFAQGLAEGLELPVFPDLITRNVATTTQTKKGRFDRYENVKDIFEVTRPALVAGKHILVADDVVTTGSTLEACVASLYQGGAGKVSVAAIASA